MCVFLDEYDYLIHLVKCAIHNEQPQELPEQLHFEAVYKYGVYHHVANIAFYSVKRLEKKPDDALYREWEDCCDRAVVREFTQSYARDEIVSSFQEANIRYLEVQGTLIKQLYPQPEYRTMSDVDFIIDLDNLSKARELLLTLGYECEDVNGVEVDAFRPPNINIELHTEYFPASSEYHSVMRPPFASVDEAGEYDINEFYLYNMLHIAKHYFSGGCGIRRVLDVYYLNLHYGEVINRQYVQSVLESAKLGDFVAELSSVANIWFGNAKRDVARSDMERYLFGSGLHGTTRNAFKNHMKTLYEKDDPFYKLKYFLRRLFAGHDIMYKHYPFLKRWKILYPFCWVHRVFRAMGPALRKEIQQEVKMVIDTDIKD